MNYKLPIAPALQNCVYVTKTPTLVAAEVVAQSAFPLPALKSTPKPLPWLMDKPSPVVVGP